MLEFNMHTNASFGGCLVFCSDVIFICQKMKPKYHLPEMAEM